MKNVFIGPRGLRAGWRVLLFIVAVAAVGFSLEGIVQLLRLPRMQAAGTLLPGPALLGEVVGFSVAVLATLIMVKLVDKQMWCLYGLPLTQALGGLFWIGTATAVVALTLQLFAMRLLHAFYFGSPHLGLVEAIHYALMWLLVFLFVGLAEEFLIRGYLLRALTDGIGFWPAAVLTSLLFAYLHTRNPGENKIGILAVFAVGLFFCLAVRRTGSLWWGVGFHSGWDWAQSYLYGVPDSGMVAQGHLLSPTIGGNPLLNGGSVGPEGSVLIFVTLGLLAIALHRAYPEVTYDKLSLTPSAVEPIAESAV